MKNIDSNVIKSFGEEWDYYKQNDSRDLKAAFDQYFHIFPKSFLNKNNVGFDMGCGSGRWARFITPKVKKLNCIEPSKKAILVAKNNLKNLKNCSFECGSSNSNSLKKDSQDFGYCLGVLHHTLNPQLGLNGCVEKLKKGAPFLVYLYYKFDNRPKWYYFIWLITVIPRKIISNLPFKTKLIICKIIALIIYLPLSRISKILYKKGITVDNIPLSDYKDKSFYFMQTDSFDRFSTRIEKRFSKDEIIKMMNKAGLHKLEFSKKAPYWVCLGYKK